MGTYGMEISGFRNLEISDWVRKKLGIWNGKSKDERWWTNDNGGGTVGIGEALIPIVTI